MSSDPTELGPGADADAPPVDGDVPGGVLGAPGKSTSRPPAMPENVTKHFLLETLMDTDEFKRLKKLQTLGLEAPNSLRDESDQVLCQNFCAGQLACGLEVVRRMKEDHLIQFFQSNFSEDAVALALATHLDLELREAKVTDESRKTELRRKVVSIITAQIVTDELLISAIKALKSNNERELITIILSPLDDETSLDDPPPAADRPRAQTPFGGLTVPPYPPATAIFPAATISATSIGDAVVDFLRATDGSQPRGIYQASVPEASMESRAGPLTQTRGPITARGLGGLVPPADAKMPVSVPFAGPHAADAHVPTNLGGISAPAITYRPKVEALELQRGKTNLPGIEVASGGMSYMLAFDSDGEITIGSDPVSTLWIPEAKPRHVTLRLTSGQAGTDPIITVEAEEGDILLFSVNRIVEGTREGEKRIFTLKARDFFRLKIPELDTNFKFGLSEEKSRSKMDFAIGIVQKISVLVENMGASLGQINQKQQYLAELERTVDFANANEIPLEEQSKKGFGRAITAKIESWLQLYQHLLTKEGPDSAEARIVHDFVVKIVIFASGHGFEIPDLSQLEQYVLQAQQQAGQKRLAKATAEAEAAVADVGHELADIISGLSVEAHNLLQAKVETIHLRAIAGFTQSGLKGVHHLPDEKLTAQTALRTLPALVSQDPRVGAVAVPLLAAWQNKGRATVEENHGFTDGFLQEFAGITKKGQLGKYLLDIIFDTQSRSQEEKEYALAQLVDFINQGYIDKAACTTAITAEMEKMEAAIARWDKNNPAPDANYLITLKTCLGLGEDLLPGLAQVANLHDLKAHANARAKAYGRIDLNIQKLEKSLAGKNTEIADKGKLSSRAISGLSGLLGRTTLQDQLSAQATLLEEKEGLERAIAVLSEQSKTGAVQIAQLIEHQLFYNDSSGEFDDGNLIKLQRTGDADPKYVSHIRRIAKIRDLFKEIETTGQLTERVQKLFDLCGDLTMDSVFGAEEIAATKSTNTPADNDTPLTRYVRAKTVTAAAKLVEKAESKIKAQQDCSPELDTLQALAEMKGIMIGPEEFMPTYTHGQVMGPERKLAEMRVINDKFLALETERKRLEAIATHTANQALILGQQAELQEAQGYLDQALQTANALMQAKNLDELLALEVKINDPKIAAAMQRHQVEVKETAIANNGGTRTFYPRPTAADGLPEKIPLRATAIVNPVNWETIVQTWREKLLEFGQSQTVAMLAGHDVAHNILVIKRCLANGYFTTEQITPQGHAPITEKDFITARYAGFVSKSTEPWQEKALDLSFLEHARTLIRVAEILRPETVLDETTHIATIAADILNAKLQELWAQLQSYLHYSPPPRQVSKRILHPCNTSVPDLEVLDDINSQDLEVRKNERKIHAIFNLLLEKGLIDEDYTKSTLANSYKPEEVCPYTAKPVENKIDNKEDGSIVYRESFKSRLQKTPCNPEPGKEAEHLFTQLQNLKLT